MDRVSERVRALSDGADASFRPPRQWPELDLLRAFAGLLMVLNHAGVDWLDPKAMSPLEDVLVFAGGLAPVVFFTATGVGRGLQSVLAPGERPLRDTLQKVLVLLLADAALWISSTWLGMDFLGFIGLSTLVLELVHRTRRPRAVALALIGLCLALRFGVAPRLDLSPAGGPLLTPLHLLLGDYSTPGFSYPLCPWLVFPLLGYLLGGQAALSARALLNARTRYALLLTALSAGGFVLCALLARRGMVFFRWGTMSFAYCVLAVSAVLAALAFVLVVAEYAGPRVTRLLSLPGTSSFVLVPVHFAVVALVHALGVELVRGAFVLAALVAVALTLGVAKVIANRITSWARASSGEALVYLTWIMVVGLLVALRSFDTNPMRLLLSVSAQLAACVLFVLTSRQPVKVATSAPSTSGSAAPRSAARSDSL